MSKQRRTLYLSDATWHHIEQQAAADGRSVSAYLDRLHAPPLLVAFVRHNEHGIHDLLRPTRAKSQSGRGNDEIERVPVQDEA